MTEMRLAEGDRAPFGYGPAYTDRLINTRVYHPVPLNFVARWVRIGWLWISRQYSPDKLEAAYRRGMEDGRARTIEHLDRIVEAIWQERLTRANEQDT